MLQWFISVFILRTTVTLLFYLLVDPRIPRMYKNKNQFSRYFEGINFPISIWIKISNLISTNYKNK